MTVICGAHEGRLKLWELPGPGGWVLSEPFATGTLRALAIGGSAYLMW